MAVHPTRARPAGRWWRSPLNPLRRHWRARPWTRRRGRRTYRGGTGRGRTSRARTRWGQLRARSTQRNQQGSETCRQHRSAIKHHVSSCQDDVKQPMRLSIIPCALCWPMFVSARVASTPRVYRPHDLLPHPIESGVGLLALYFGRVAHLARIHQNRRRRCRGLSLALGRVGNDDVGLVGEHAGDVGPPLTARQRLPGTIGRCPSL